MHAHELVALVPALAQRGHALAAQTEGRAALRAGRHLHRGLAEERRHLERAAKRGEGELDRNLAEEVVILTLEEFVLPHVEHDVEVAVLSAGEAGLAGGQDGDLYIVLNVRQHELFERQDDDLFCEIPIKFTLATLGGTLEVPTLFGKATVKVPAGTQSGTTFRLRGKGMPSLRQRGHQGDQLVRVHVEVPSKLTGEQEKLLKEFARISGDAEHPTSESWFAKAKKFF